jgi:hypothetical protein
MSFCRNQAWIAKLYRNVMRAVQYRFGGLRVKNQNGFARNAILLPRMQKKEYLHIEINDKDW